MNVIVGRPPNYNEIGKVFGFANIERAVFTYGDDIYNPMNGAIDEPLGFHEATHAEQQEREGGPKKWWKRFLTEPKFRLAQELQAYGHQYRRFCELHHDRNLRARELFRLATDISSAQYGRMVSLTEARKQLQRYF